MKELALTQYPKNEELENVPQRGVSTIDNFSGKHTTSIIVAALFFMVLFGYILVICIKPDISQTFHTGMISLLTLLIGFFSGTKTSK